jgi:hypothetical protein
VLIVLPFSPRRIAVVRPAASTTPEIPVFPTRTYAMRFSIARSIAIRKSCSCTGPPTSPSLVMLRKKSAPRRPAAAASGGYVFSTQMSGAIRTMRSRQGSSRISMRSPETPGGWTPHARRVRYRWAR